MRFFFFFFFFAWIESMFLLCNTISERTFWKRYSTALTMNLRDSKYIMPSLFFFLISHHKNNEYRGKKRTILLCNIIVLIPLKYFARDDINRLNECLSIWLFVTHKWKNTPNNMHRAKLAPNWLVFFSSSQK